MVKELRKHKIYGRHSTFVYTLATPEVFDTFYQYWRIWWVADENATWHLPLMNIFCNYTYWCIYQVSCLVLHDILSVDDRFVKEHSMSLEVINLETLVNLRVKYLSVNQHLQIQYAKPILETLNERRGYSVPRLAILWSL